MTISQAKEKIVQFLYNNDSVSFEDFNKFIPTLEKNETGIACCLGALQELTSEQLVFLNPLADTTKPSTLIWVLKQKLSEKEQTIVISGVLSARISEIVNSFGEQMGVDNIASNSLNIREQDLHIVCDIVNLLAEQNIEGGGVIEPAQQEKPKNKNK